jgi:hypothetical protein
MKYEIKGDLTKVTFEKEDQRPKPRPEGGEYRGETVICQPEGGCKTIGWPKQGKKCE